MSSCSAVTFGILVLLVFLIFCFFVFLLFCSWSCMMILLIVCPGFSNPIRFCSITLYASSLIPILSVIVLFFVDVIFYHI